MDNIHCFSNDKLGSKVRTPQQRLESVAQGHSCLCSSPLLLHTGGLGKLFCQELLKIGSVQVADWTDFPKLLERYKFRHAIQRRSSL